MKFMYSVDSCSVVVKYKKRTYLSTLVQLKMLELDETIPVNSNYLNTYMTQACSGNISGHQSSGSGGSPEFWGGSPLFGVSVGRLPQRQRGLFLKRPPGTSFI
jgi:hypothetical protein